jgi:hypothetical protein
VRAIPEASSGSSTPRWTESDPLRANRNALAGTRQQELPNARSGTTDQRRTTTGSAEATPDRQAKQDTSQNWPFCTAQPRRTRHRQAAHTRRYALSPPYEFVTLSDPVSTFAKRTLPPFGANWQLATPGWQHGPKDRYVRLRSAAAVLRSGGAWLVASRGNRACALRWLMATWSPAARLSSVSGAAVKAAEAPWSKVARVLEPHRHTLTIAAARGTVAGPNLLHQ